MMLKNVTQVVSCPVCGGQKSGVTYTVTDRIVVGTDKFDYNVCEDCKSIWLHNVPNDLTPYYKDYILHKWKPEMGILPPWRLKAGKIVTDYKLTEKDSVIDFGAADVQLLWAIGEAGVSEDLKGLRAYDAFADEMNVGDIKQQNTLPTDRKFTFLHASHVIEHATDMVRMIQDMRSVLTKGGRAVIIYPNPESLTLQIYGSNWLALDAPRHIAIPSRSGITKLLEENGFKVEDVKYEGGNYVVMGSQCYKDGGNYHSIANHFKSEYLHIFEKASKGFNIIANRNGVGDEITIVAKAV